VTVSDTLTRSEMSDVRYNAMYKLESNMRRIFLYVTAMLFSLTSNLMPIFAEEANPTDSSEQQIQQKDECLLVARNCGNSAVSIQDKIERLKEEIAKGRAVYTIDDLNNLKQKLDEVSRILDYLLEK